MLALRLPRTLALLALKLGILLVGAGIVMVALAQGGLRMAMERLERRWR